jgi:hypothetical protein
MKYIDIYYDFLYRYSFESIGLSQLEIGKGIYHEICP